ncbi:MAG TPA: Maf family protein [Myxococcota bacterium]|jgi:septum formation protein|nr:Maf family protein [Myxococcota bacterium]
MRTLWLASASPRRKELLESVGVQVHVMPAAVDEGLRADEGPEAYARRLADAKAEAVARRADAPPGALVLGADTVVVTGAMEVLGKPQDAADARRMLEALAGRTHMVLTAYSLWEAGGAPGLARLRETAVVRTDVEVRPMRPAEIDGYLATGEWRDKAGAYAVQGVYAAFVRALHGAWANVVGLPLCEVVEALARAGATWPPVPEAQ